MTHGPPKCRRPAAHCLPGGNSGTGRRISRYRAARSSGEIRGRGAAPVADRSATSASRSHPAQIAVAALRKRRAVGHRTRPALARAGFGGIALRGPSGRDLAPLRSRPNRGHVRRRHRSACAGVGTVLTTVDVTVEQRDITALPPGYLNDPNIAVGTHREPRDFGWDRFDQSTIAGEPTPYSAAKPSP